MTRIRVVVAGIMRAVSTTDCEDWCEWLCECCDTEVCASYRPPDVKQEVEINECKQLKLFDI